MRLIIGVLAVFWLLCGVAGDWWLERDDGLHWKKIALGPVTLVRAFNERPVTYRDR